MTSRAHNELRRRVELLRRTMPTTPMLQLAAGDFDLQAKLEFHNMMGSIKDRPALWMLHSAIKHGEIQPETTVIESSSGNLASALALFCRFLSLRFIPVIDPNTLPATRSMLESLCERVELVTKHDDTGGFLKSRLQRVQELRETSGHTYWPNQYGNREAMLAHYHLTGAELCTSLTRLDYAFVAVSSGGTIAGVSRRLKERFPNVRIVAVDLEGSVIFGHPPRPRRIPGIGSSIVPPLLQEAHIDDIVMVSESEAIQGCHDLLRRHRIFTGGSSGAVYAAVHKTLAGHRGLVRPRVAIVCPDRGTAYVDTIYNPAWCASVLTEAAHVNEERGNP